MKLTLLFEKYECLECGKKNINSSNKAVCRSCEKAKKVSGNWSPPRTKKASDSMSRTGSSGWRKKASTKHES